MYKALMIFITTKVVNSSIFTTNNSIFILFVILNCNLVILFSINVFYNIM